MGREAAVALKSPLGVTCSDAGVHSVPPPGAPATRVHSGPAVKFETQTTGSQSPFKAVRTLGRTDLMIESLTEL